MHANGENLNGYVVQNTHNFALTDNFKGGVEKQILVMDSTGVSNNRLQRAGNMNANVGAEFVIRSPWGVGIMGVDSTNRFRCYGLYAYNSVLNDWHLQSGDIIVGSGNFAGDATRKELLIVKP